MVDHGFKSQSGQTKDYKIGICWSSSKHMVLRSKSRDQNQDIVSEWSDISIPWTVVSVSQHYRNTTKCDGLVQSGHHLIEMQHVLTMILLNKQKMLILTTIVRQKSLTDVTNRLLNHWIILIIKTGMSWNQNYSYT